MLLVKVTKYISIFTSYDLSNLIKNFILRKLIPKLVLQFKTIFRISSILLTWITNDIEKNL